MHKSILLSVALASSTIVSMEPTQNNLPSIAFSGNNVRADNFVAPGGQIIQPNGPTTNIGAQTVTNNTNQFHREYGAPGASYAYRLKDGIEHHTIEIFATTIALLLKDAIVATGQGAYNWMWPDPNVARAQQIFDQQALNISAEEAVKLRTQIENRLEAFIKLKAQRATACQDDPNCTECIIATELFQATTQEVEALSKAFRVQRDRILKAAAAATA